jgi:hypothetical protein
VADLRKTVRVIVPLIRRASPSGGSRVHVIVLVTFEECNGPVGGFGVSEQTFPFQCA